jgi:hypothetical protein
MRNREVCSSRDVNRMRTKDQGAQRSCTPVCFRLLFLSSSPHATASGTGHPFSDEAVLNAESIKYLDVLVETLAERKFSAAQVVIDASFAEMLEGLEVLVAFRVVAVGAPPAVAGFTVAVVHAPRAGHHEALCSNFSIA